MDVKPIDLNSLTIDELEIFEDIADASIDVLSDPKAKKAKVLKALVYVAALRDDPNAKLEDIGKLTLVELNELVTLENPQTAA